MTSPETLELEAVDAALAGRYVAPEHAELAELALLLRDDTPAPAPAWVAQLDRRVEAGFPAKPRRERRFWVWTRNLAPAAGLAVAVVALVVGASVMSGGQDDSGEGGGSISAETESAPEPATDSAGGGFQLDSESRTSGDPGSDRRRARDQQRSATLTLAVPRREIDSAANRVGQVTGELGGFVASSNLSSSGGGHLQLRVPSDRLDDAIRRLSDVGRVRELSRRSVDITSNVVSARDRLSDARAERKALLAQLAVATTVNETESIRARLDIVAREIAAARRRLARVNNQAELRRPVGDAGGPHRGRRRGGRLDACRRLARRAAGARGRRRRGARRGGDPAPARAGLAADLAGQARVHPPRSRAGARHGVAGILREICPRALTRRQRCSGACPSSTSSRPTTCAE